jgi:FkbM family methyltransferase
MITGFFHTDAVLTRLVRYIYAFRQLNRVQLDPHLKQKIRRTSIRTFAFRRYDVQNRIAQVAGYRIRFLSFKTLTYLFNEIFLGNQYCFATNEKRPYIIDCGSNIGMSVLYFKFRFPDAEIVAFEPDPDAFNCLAENVEVNNLRGVSVQNKALAQREGPVEFFYDEKNPGSLGGSIVKERMPQQRRWVEAVCLSKYVGRKVDFLKLDVEGAEQDVLENLLEDGKLRLIEQMVIEYHHHIVKDKDSLSHLLQLLECAGFGYQIAGHLSQPYASRAFQDILIYAYQKHGERKESSVEAGTALTRIAV